MNNKIGNIIILCMVTAILFVAIVVPAFTDPASAVQNLTK